MILSFWNSIEDLGKINDFANGAIIALSVLITIAGLVIWQTGKRIEQLKDIQQLELQTKLNNTEASQDSLKQKISEQEHQLTDAQRQIQKLQPKPLKERIIDFLKRLDPGIIPAAKTGQRNFGGQFTTAQLAELQSLCAEDKYGKFIKEIETRNTIISGTMHGGIAFAITDELLR